MKRSSGYWRVNFGRKTCFMVSAIPLRISGMYVFCQKERSFFRVCVAGVIPFVVIRSPSPNE